MAVAWRERRGQTRLVVACKKNRTRIPHLQSRRMHAAREHAGTQKHAGPPRWLGIASSPACQLWQAGCRRPCRQVGGRLPARRPTGRSRPRAQTIPPSPPRGVVLLGVRAPALTRDGPERRRRPPLARGRDGEARGRAAAHDGEGAHRCALPAGRLAVEPPARRREDLLRVVEGAAGGTCDYGRARRENDGGRERGRAGVNAEER